MLQQKETMQEGLLPRILAYAGAITVERTWRAKGEDVKEKKEVNPNDTENIKIALEDRMGYYVPARDNTLV